jgi:hypothetical protein
MTMRLPRFRVRTLMAAVLAVALLLWGARMGARSYDYHGRAKTYGEQERGWREIAARKRWDASFASQCAEYYALLTRKYRRAMWCPWEPVVPDPYAPGVAEALKQANAAAAQNAPALNPPMPRSGTTMTTDDVPSTSR